MWPPSPLFSRLQASGGLPPRALVTPPPIQEGEDEDDEDLSPEERGGRGSSGMEGWCGVRGCGVWQEELQPPRPPGCIGDMSLALVRPCLGLNSSCLLSYTMIYEICVGIMGTTFFTLDNLISFPSHLSYLFSEELITCIYNESNKLINIES